jgi:hypothetical protein
MKKAFPGLCLAIALLLTACSGTAAETPAPTSTPVPTPEVTAATPEPEYTGAYNPLTGLPIANKWANSRPLAIMLNNLKAALPQHGVSQADIIYEVLAEGGITRMLGVFQTVEGVGDIGSVRSSRTYYLELALGHDAIYLHAGGSPDAYAKIKEWAVTALDCVNGPYEGTLYWRDQGRIKSAGYELSVFTSGDTILELFPTYRFRQEHEAGYTYNMTFLDDGTPAGSETANIITVPFSTYKTGVFRYDLESGLYMAEEYGKDYVDGNTNEQVGVTNVIILKTACDVISGDDKGRLAVDLTSGGDGWYACGGKIVPIHWSKEDRNSQFVYTTADGKVLSLGRGTSYVNIIPLKNNITVE